MGDVNQPDEHRVSGAVLLALINERTKVMKVDVDEIKRALQTQYVRRNEFVLVRALVFGCVGLILIAVVGALIARVVITDNAARGEVPVPMIERK